MLWDLSWGMVREGFTFPRWPAPRSWLLFGPRLAICLLSGMGSKTRSLPPCRSSAPLIRPFGLLGRWSMSSIPGPSASGGLPKTKLVGRHPRSLESEFLRMGLVNLHSNWLPWGVLRNGKGREPRTRACDHHTVPCRGGTHLPGCREGVWVAGS